MALPSLTELKQYLRVETDAEDAVITDVLASATAWAEGLIGKPITAEERTLVVDGATYDDYGRHQFYLPVWPVSVDSEDVAVITDKNGDTVDDSTYTVDARTGLFQTVVGEHWRAAPFSVVATVGLSVHPDYATKIEPKVRSLILGCAAILYKQRNPNAVSDSSGAGVSVSYGDHALPPYLEQIATLLRGSRIR